jgi:hypothetical protein
MACPLWVKSGHVQWTRRCPLCAKSGHHTRLYPANSIGKARRRRSSTIASLANFQLTLRYSRIEIHSIGSRPKVDRQSDTIAGVVCGYADVGDFCANLSRSPNCRGRTALTELALPIHRSSSPACAWIVTKASTNRHVTPIKVAAHISTAPTGAFPNVFRR